MNETTPKTARGSNAKSGDVIPPPFLLAPKFTGVGRVAHKAGLRGVLVNFVEEASSTSFELHGAEVEPPRTETSSCVERRSSAPVTPKLAWTLLAPASLNKSRQLSTVKGKGYLKYHCFYLVVDLRCQFQFKTDDKFSCVDPFLRLLTAEKSEQPQDWNQLSLYELNAWLINLQNTSNLRHSEIKRQEEQNYRRRLASNAHRLLHWLSDHLPNGSADEPSYLNRKLQGGYLILPAVALSDCKREFHKADVIVSLHLVNSAKLYLSAPSG